MADKKQFTEEQIARYRKVFDSYDLNKDGVLEAKEIAEASKKLGYRIPTDEIMALLAKLDFSADGSLNFDQFLETMPGGNFVPEEEHAKAEYRQKFQEFDADGNGFISPEEAYQVLHKELGFNEDRSKKMLDMYDVNADGKLCYEEFVALYCRLKEKRGILSRAFKEFDKEGKGYVSKEDAKGVLGGVLFTDEEVEQLFAKHDVNKDNMLQYEEFIQFWGY